VKRCLAATAGSSFVVVIIGGMPKQACDAPAAASREHVKRECGGVTNPKNFPEDCTFIIDAGKRQR
jgi:hypothetical protein